MKLKLTARCLIISNNNVLVQVSRRGNFYKLPGGKLKPQEPLIEALKREIREELGLRVVGEPRLVAVVDSFYRDRSDVVHEISFYFICNVEGEPTPREDHLEIKWVDIESTDIEKVKPKAVADIIKFVRKGGLGYEPAYYISVEL